MNIIDFIFKVYCKIKSVRRKLLINCEKRKLGFCGQRVKVEWPNVLSSKIFLYDDVYVYGHAKFIINRGGRFIMKHHSGCSQGVTVITGYHGKKIGTWFHDTMWTGELDTETTVTVEEDARIGANATLLPAVTIGRGAQIGACSVVTKSIPPYSIAAGNPARVIKFIFSPEEILEHEKLLYSESERFTLEAMIEIQKKYSK